MKICILTQPLYLNYGGLLQAYALQKVLKQMGNEVWTADINPYMKNLEDSDFSLIRESKELVKKALEFFHLRESRKYVPTLQQYKDFQHHIETFKSEHMNMTERMDHVDQEILFRNEFDTYIVGSDQIWRPSYSIDIENYFLKFCTDCPVKKIAYAASFGVSDWEYSEEETRKCAELIKKFNAVSVREQSGTDLCRKHLGTDAVMTLDPTLLLEARDYLELTEKENTRKNTGILSFILDTTSDKLKVIRKLEKTLGLESFSPAPACTSGKKKKDSFSSVVQWLADFHQASYVVTDSFHGTVFSIIFNKPFTVIANRNRGICRFESLLKMFGLEDRLISYSSELTEDQIRKEIDYDKVNLIKDREKKKSLSFLKESLDITGA